MEVISPCFAYAPLVVGDIQRTGPGPPGVDRGAKRRVVHDFDQRSRR